MERAGSGCYKSCISSIEQATIPVVLGTCPAWIGLVVGVIHVVSPVQSNDFTNGNKTRPAWSGTAELVIPAASLVVLGTCPACSGPSVSYTVRGQK